MILSPPALPAFALHGRPGNRFPYLGSQLALRLRGDRVTLNGSTVSQWTDLSGNGRHYSQGVASRQPTWAASAINGRAGLTFDGSNNILTGTAFTALSGVGSAEVFVVMQLAADPPAAGFGGCWQIGSAAAFSDLVPYSVDGKTYCGIFSTTRQTVGALGAGFYASPRIVSAYSAASDWRFFVDGTQQYSTGTNTYGVGTTTAIGGDPDESAIRLAGTIAEVLVFAPKLSGTQRRAVLAYLGARYGITVP